MTISAHGEREERHVDLSVLLARGDKLTNDK